jgi:2-iminoacetate synthase ThiH
MVECNWIDEKEFERVASEATARMTGGDWSFKREICIYESNWCVNCGRCADEDLISEANSNYMKAVF